MMVVIGNDYGGIENLRNSEGRSLETHGAVWDIDSLVVGLSE